LKTSKQERDRQVALSPRNAGADRKDATMPHTTAYLREQAQYLTAAEKEYYDFYVSDFPEGTPDEISGLQSTLCRVAILGGRTWWDDLVRRWRDEGIINEELWHVHVSYMNGVEY